MVYKLSQSTPTYAIAKTFCFGLALSGQLLQTIAAFMMPSGALQYFNLDSCPDGWNSRTDLAGLNLIGIGTYSGYRENGEAETRVYVRGDTGGEMKHVLTSSEGPLHDHGAAPAASFFASQGTMGETNGLAGSNGQYVGGAGRIFKTATSGTGEAHQNMGPWFATILCEKIDFTDDDDDSSSTVVVNDDDDDMETLKATVLLLQAQTKDLQNQNDFIMTVMEIIGVVASVLGVCIAIPGCLFLFRDDGKSPHVATVELRHDGQNGGNPIVNRRGFNGTRHDASF